MLIEFIINSKILNKLLFYLILFIKCVENYVDVHLKNNALGDAHAKSQI